MGKKQIILIKTVNDKTVVSPHSSSDQNLHKLFEGKNIYKLTPTEPVKREGKLKLEEIGSALKQMKNNECPGVDGFLAQFFKTFWDKLKYFVLRG